MERKFMKSSRRTCFWVIVNVLLDIVIVMLTNKYWSGDNRDFEYLYTQSGLLVVFGVMILQYIWIIAKFMSCFNDYVIIRYVHIERLAFKMIRVISCITFTCVILYNLLFFVTVSIIEKNFFRNELIYLFANMVLQLLTFNLLGTLMIILYIKFFCVRKTCVTSFVMTMMWIILDSKSIGFFFSEQQDIAGYYHNYSILLMINVIFILYLLHCKKGDAYEIQK